MNYNNNNNNNNQRNKDYRGEYDDMLYNDIIDGEEDVSTLTAG